MDFGTAILYVLAVLAIIAVAGLVIYLLAALVVSIIDKKEVKPFAKSAEEESKEQLLLENKDYQLTFDDEPKAEEKAEEPKEVNETIDFDLADEERKEILERQRAVAQEQPEEEEVEEAEEDDLEAMYQKLIADINAEATEEAEEAEEEPTEGVAEEAEEEVTEEEEEVTSEEYNELKDQIAELKSLLLAKQEPVEEEKEEQLEEIVEEPVEEVKEEPVEKEEVDSKELEKLKVKLAELQAEKEELAKKLEEKPEVIETETESVEALLARKSVLEERLAESEKELKANKKEYVPLSRIRKNLENDKAKLRRKEAVVAKQKVVLFGVNNYVVDPEKEKKLSEDLDVLDALRLSVQHCEEVMKENEDRYPILEKTNAILTKQVEDLKADIADLDGRIAKAQGEADAE